MRFPASLFTVAALGLVMTTGPASAQANPDKITLCHSHEEAYPWLIHGKPGYSALMMQSIEKQLPTIETPVQILAPQGSPFVKPALAYELRNRLKDCEMDIFPGHRHGLVLSGAHIACDSMMNFIKRRFG